VLFLSSWYLCLAVPLRAGRPGRLVTIWAAAAALMGLAWAAALWLLLQLLQDLALLAPPPAGPALAGPELLALAATGAFFYLVTMVLHYLLIAQERAREAESRSRGLRALAREAELKALRAQLNPHFLFNSLNSISALTASDPKGARRMCVMLAEFLRMGLRLGERATVSLAEELELLRAYLAIEEIRFGPRLQVRWAVDPLAETAEVPALLLQPLGENAIKHGLARLPEGGPLDIAVTLRDGRVQIRVANAADPEGDPGAAGTGAVGLGMGLRQVQQRLRGHFGAGAQFHAGPLAGGFEVVLGFPLALEEAADA
jgi:LytS/YehU family sensor histidine kinase